MSEKSKVIQLEDYKITKMKKDAHRGELRELLSTTFGQELYLWLVTLVIEPETAEKLDIGGRGKEFINNLGKKAGLSEEGALRFAYETFSEVLFGKALDKITFGELEEWMLSVQEKIERGE